MIPDDEVPANTDLENRLDELFEETLSTENHTNEEEKFKIFEESEEEEDIKASHLTTRSKTRLNVHVKTLELRKLVAPGDKGLRVNRLTC